MDPYDMRRQRFLVLMDFDLKYHNIRHGTDLEFVSMCVGNFISSGFSEQLTPDRYSNGDNTARSRSIFRHYDNESVIILEVYTLLGIDTPTPNRRVAVSLDRYHLHKTEKVYPSVSFIINDIRKYSLGVFFENLTWNLFVNSMMA